MGSGHPLRGRLDIRKVRHVVVPHKHTSECAIDLFGGRALVDRLTENPILELSVDAVRSGHLLEHADDGAGKLQNRSGGGEKPLDGGRAKGLESGLEGVGCRPGSSPLPRSVASSDPDPDWSAFASSWSRVVKPACEAGEIPIVPLGTRALARAWPLGIKWR
ncbi:hypothetical protein PG997_011117 [Apiospora hydei]|uniref:Uncharacterized protein n=1 Tax=Apiospora hydei TaxID=1337664 RepID=A0ABR1VI72_9PEZI